MVETDYYELLQVERDARTRATIKSAYRKLAMECHPDRNGGCTNAEAKFKAISEAYECLKDPQKRAAYDRFGHAAFRGQAASAAMAARRISARFADIFDNIFGEFMGGAQRAAARSNIRRGSDLRYDLEIRLEDAFDGTPGRARGRYHRARASPAPARAPRPARRAQPARRAAAAARSAPSQGFFVVEQHLPGLPRRRRDDRRSLPAPAAAKGRASKRAALSVNDPGRGRRGHPHPPRRRRRGGGARRPAAATSTSSSTSPGTRSSSARARPCSRECPVSFTTAALGGCIEVPGLDGARHEIKIPGRHPVGQAAAPARRRHAGHERPRPWRHGHAGRRSRRPTE